MIDKIKQREEEILGMFEIYQTLHKNIDYKHWDTNIVELSGALLNAQFEAENLKSCLG